MQEAGLAEVKAHEDNAKVDRILKSVLDELFIGCNRYVTLSKSSSTGGPGLGKTKLDRERIKLCQRELEDIALIAKNLKASVTRDTCKNRMKTIRTCLEKLKFLLEDVKIYLQHIKAYTIVHLMMFLLLFLFVFRTPASTVPTGCVCMAH